jgi:hypothetical protein
MYSAKDIKSLHLIAPELGENSIIVACDSVLGYAIPSVVLCKGQRFQSEWSNNMYSGSTIEITVRGSMTSQAFMKWIARCLIYIFR